MFDRAHKLNCIEGVNRYRLFKFYLCRCLRYVIKPVLRGLISKKYWQFASEISSALSWVRCRSIFFIFLSFRLSAKIFDFFSQLKLPETPYAVLSVLPLFSSLFTSFPQFFILSLSLTHLCYSHSLSLSLSLSPLFFSSLLNSFLLWSEILLYNLSLI